MGLGGRTELWSYSAVGTRYCTTVRGCSSSRSHLVLPITNLNVWLDFKAQLTTGSSSQSCSLFYCRNWVQCYIWSRAKDNPDNGMAKRSEIEKHHPFLFPSLWPFLMLMEKSGRATAIFLPIPSYPLHVRAQVCLANGPCVSPSTHSLCISEITGQSLAQKVLTTTSNFCPCWPCSPEYKHHVPKGQLRSSSLATYSGECRSFTWNHWFILVSSKNKLQHQWRMKRSCVVFIIQQQKLPPGGTCH